MSEALRPREAATPIRIGVLRLTDSAPVICAHELGFFADEGLDVALTIEPSWANVADKLAHGALDAAAITHPLAIAISLGLRGEAQKLIVPYSLSLGGNTVTLAKAFAEEIKAATPRGGRLVDTLAQKLRGMAGKPKLAVVHDYSTHNLQLRYWLATAGMMADRDVEIVVTPPARTVEALRSGLILGFCAGAPWGEAAARERVGATLVTSNQIWRDAPEKALGVRELWARAHPEALAALLRALYRAARFCDAPRNSAYVAAMLGRRAYLDLPAHTILSSLPGTLGGEAPSLFLRHAATYPWLSHGHWMHAQMARWGFLEADETTKAAVERIYRPDIYAEALGPAGAPIPLGATKTEGGHLAPWRLDARPEPIEMEPDGFCDGAVFEA